MAGGYTVSMQVGDVKTVTPNTIPGGQNCTYATSDATKVTVGTAGPAASCVLTAVAQGSATITVTLPGTPSPGGTVALTVNVAPAGTNTDYISSVAVA